MAMSGMEQMMNSAFQKLMENPAIAQNIEAFKTMIQDGAERQIRIESKLDLLLSKLDQDEKVKPTDPNFARLLEATNGQDSKNSGNAGDSGIIVNED